MRGGDREKERETGRGRNVARSGSWDPRESDAPT